MTIDEMLSEVAKITGTAPEKRSEETSRIKPTPSMAVSAQDAPGSLITKPAIGLAIAKELAYCVEQAAQAIGVSVVIAICDEGGRLVLKEAMDNSFIASIKAAEDKAYTAVALKMPTDRALNEARGGALDGLTNGNGILLLGGGYPLIYNGAVIGGVGVSGGTKDQDSALARAAVLYLEKRLKNQ